MLKDTSDYFESFTKTELDHPEDPEYPESPEGPDDPEGPEPWWPIQEEHQEANGDNQINKQAFIKCPRIVCKMFSRRPSI